MAEIVTTRARVGRRKTNTTEEFKEKMEALSQHFNAVVFPPLRERLDIRGHESLLKRLGLWEFANLDFGETVREDMVKELVLCYKNYPSTYNGYSRVNGAGITLNRTALGRALLLPPPPVKKKGAQGRHFWVTKEEGSFLEDLIWGFMVLRDDVDDDSVMSDSYVVEFVKVLGELRFESADWAGLVWFMVSRELSRGTDLGNCYYASHLQLLLKHQRPELFENSGKESVGITELVGDVDEGERLRKLQFGNDDQLMESLGNKGNYLLNLKANLNQDSHSSNCDVSVTEPGSSPSNPVEIAGLKRTHRDAHLEMKSMQVTQAHSQNAHVKRKNERVMDLDSEGLVFASSQEKNDVNEDGVVEVKEAGAASEANGCKLLSDLLIEDVNMAKIDACFEKTDEESQDAFKHLERGEGKIDFLVPQASVMAGNAGRSLGFLGQFPCETNMARCNAIGANEERVGEWMDFDICAEKLKVWAARFADSARTKVEEKQISNSMLQEKIKRQNQMIQQYELMLHEERQQKGHYELMLQMERQQKLTGDRKYERELHLMDKVLVDYRKAIKQTITSFAKYRERAQLPEEPLYMPHPDGGGNVILVSEWKKLEDERQKMAIKARVEEFEQVWMGKMEEQLGVFDKYCGRLKGLEHEVRKIRGSF